MASETDINNEGQTISIKPPTTPPGTPPKTGDSLPVIPTVIIMITAFAGIAGIVISKRRKKKD